MDFVSIMSMGLPIRAAYCRKLRASLDALTLERPSDAAPGMAYI